MTGINSRNCPSCSRGEGQGHHNQCPENPDNKQTPAMIDQVKLAALRIAWDAVPEGATVPEEVAAWIQPLISAVTDIVNPSYAPEDKKGG